MTSPSDGRADRDRATPDGDGTLIVGGGIAGLALGGLFARSGRACELIERAAEFAPVGAGIVLGVNAMRVMRELGVADELVERGHVLGEMEITDENGWVLGRTSLARLVPRFGPSVALHRAVLHEVLAKRAAAVPMRLDTAIEQLDDVDGSPRVRFSDGREGRYAEVVGADGLYSRTRAQLFGDVPVRYSGYTCWRLVVERPREVVRAQEMWGRGLRFGVVPIDGDRVYCFAVANAARDTEDPEDGRLERFRERFSAFSAPVPAILERLSEPNELLHNDLCEVVHHPWHRGGAVLVGDAAHGMTPNMGQGAAMALEDVSVLSELAATAALAGRPLRGAFADWSARRATRVQWVQDQSRRIGRIGQWEGRTACALRNRLLRLVPDRASERALVRMAEQAI